MRNFLPINHFRGLNLIILLIKRIHDVENKPKDIPGNYAIQNPNKTARDGRSNKDKNGPRYYGEAEDARRKQLALVRAKSSSPASVRSEIRNDSVLTVGNSAKIGELIVSHTATGCPSDSFSRKDPLPRAESK